MRNYLINEIRRQGLDQLSPSDAQLYFGRPNPTAEDWADLMTVMMSMESNFRSDLTYRENFTDRNGDNVVSTGLLQLSQESLRGYGYNYSTEDLMNPSVNISAGVGVLRHWVERDGVIGNGGNTNSSARGGSRYWSVLRNNNGKRGTIINTLKGNSN